MHPQLIEAYRCLGLPPNSSLDEVKKSYRLLAKKYHPDAHSDKANEERFIEISEAYELLTDYFSNPNKYQFVEAQEKEPTVKRAGKEYSAEEMKARMQRAKRMAQEEAFAEYESIYNAYKQIRKPSFKRIHLIVTIFSLLITTFLFFDYFLPSQTREVQVQSILKIDNSTSFEQAATISTYGNELFQVEVQILSDVVSNHYTINGATAFVEKSNLLKTPRSISFHFSEDQTTTYSIDEPLHHFFFPIVILLLSSLFYYLIKTKNQFQAVIFFYASMGLTGIGCIILLFNDIIGRIFNML